VNQTRIQVHGPAGDLNVPFLLHDDGADNPDRMIIFGTTNSLGGMSRSAKLHADGTFKVAPKPFTPMYVIHYEDGGSLFPAVFVLLTKKTKAIYVRMCQVLLTLCQTDATAIVTDFEFQCMQSFGDNFRIEIQGCFFHLSQAIMKNARRFDLFKKMKNSPLKKQHYIMLRALAFLPSTLIPAGFDALVQIITRHNHLDDFQGM
jgi:hypothetical protein